MAKSPGHRKWPEHQVREVPLQERIQALIAGDVLADSRDVIKVEEDGHPARYYFPRTDIRMEALQHTEATSECPFKGKASYFTLNADGRQWPDAGWSYEEPYEEHEALKGRIALYDDRIPELEIRLA